MGVYGSPELLPNNSDSSNDFITKNMIFCMYCGFKYSKKLKKCPQCGKKHAQPFYHKWWFWIIALIMVCNIFSSPNSNESSNTVPEVDNEQVEQVVISEEEYKASCNSISYVDIARNPNEYVGQKAVFSGKVIQVQESGKRVVLRVNVTKGEYGIWDDTVYVDYQRKDDNESRVLEEDIITMYGEIKGIKDYTAIFGNQISIPHLKVEYIEIN